jgi:hypothetical protein
VRKADKLSAICEHIVYTMLDPQRLTSYRPPRPVAGIVLIYYFSADRRKDLSFTVAAASREHSHSRVRVSQFSNHILLSQIKDTPNLEGQVLVFISPRTA